MAKYDPAAELIEIMQTMRDQQDAMDPSINQLMSRVTTVEQSQQQLNIVNTFNANTNQVALLDINTNQYFTVHQQSHDSRMKQSHDNVTLNTINSNQSFVVIFIFHMFKCLK